MKAATKKLIRANYSQVLFVAAAFLLMVIIGNAYASRIVREQTFRAGEETMNTIEASVAGSLSEAELMFSGVHQTLDAMLSDGSSNESILTYLVSVNSYYSDEQSSLPDFMKIYGYIREEWMDGSGWTPPADYEPTARPWYIGAAENEGGVFFSEPYLDADTKGMCISFSREVYDASGTFRGVLAVDFTLDRITRYVARQQIAGDGYGILVDDSMKFTSHRDSGLTGVSMAEAGGDYARLAGMIKDGETVSAERFTDSDGTDSIGFFRTVFNGWNIGVVIPWRSYYGPVIQMGVTLSVIGAVLMAVLSYILVRTRIEKMRSDEENLSKSNFLARMSHEMRTPMNAVIGMTGLARRTSDSDKISDCLEKIDAAATHLLGVINDVLDMSKIEADKLELNETDFNLSALLKQVTNLAGFTIEEKKQHFASEVDGDVPVYVKADRQRLAQVLTNLLSNASKFTPEGGNIQLRVKRLADADGMCRLRIEVEDDGIGVSKEQQERLFKSFEQADNSISRKYGGSGLGLSISKRIIELMRGRAWIESELGSGANFIFEISLGFGEETLGEETVFAGEDAAGRPGADAAQTYSDGLFAGKRVLLAEDIEINREIVIALLEPLQMKIDCAENGAEAVRMFSEDPKKYDAVFMDVQMPEMDGYEATRHIRALGSPHAKSVPIIAMTANVFQDDVAKCIDAGMNGHVGKPLDFDEVLGKLRAFLTTYIGAKESYEGA